MNPPETVVRGRATLGAFSPKRANQPRFLVFTILLALLMSLNVAASPPPPSEREVKAAFIGKFLHFVQWRPSRAPRQSEPFVIAVLGTDPFALSLPAALAQFEVNGAHVRVVMASNTTDVLSAHLVFIGVSERRRLPSIVRDLENSRVVTVGDTPGFGEAGVMLNLYVSDDRRVRFEANTSAAARAGVRLHSQLLRLARIVG
jgi:hypothetical protein